MTNQTQEKELQELIETLKQEGLTARYFLSQITSHLGEITDEQARAFSQVDFLSHPKLEEAIQKYGKRAVGEALGKPAQNAVDILESTAAKYARAFDTSDPIYQLFQDCRMRKGSEELGIYTAEKVRENIEALREGKGTVNIAGIRLSTSRALETRASESHSPRLVVVTGAGIGPEGEHLVDILDPQNGKRETVAYKTLVFEDDKINNAYLDAQSKKAA